MDEQTRIYTMHTDKLKDPAVFAKRFEEVSPERQEKIARIRSQQEKRLSLASALLLDEGLRVYGLSEKDMDIRTGEHGKPYFADAPSIHFNLSHSAELAMAAFSDRVIGCDIQKMRTFPSEARILSIAERFYTKKECRWILSSEIPRERTIRFYRLWVLKESYAKARGEGLAIVYKDAGFLMDSTPSLEEEDRENWQFTEYSFGGYRAAVCRKREI